MVNLEQLVELDLVSVFFTRSWFLGRNDLDQGRVDLTPTRLGARNIPAHFDNFFVVWRRAGLCRQCHHQHLENLHLVDSFQQSVRLISKSRCFS